MIGKPGPLCDQCPLKDKPGPVWGVGKPSATAMFVGMAPEQTEIDMGLPFAGGSGRILNRSLYKAGLNRETQFVTNVVKCFVPAGSHLPPKAIECCKPLLDQEMDCLPNLKVVCALGIEPMQALTGKKMTVMHNGKVAKKGLPTYWLRGAVHRATTEIAHCTIGSWHPAGLARAGFVDSPIFDADIAKVARWARGEGRTWTESFNYHPTNKEVEEYAEYLISKGKFAVDIETPESVLEEDEAIGRGPSPIDVIGLSGEIGECVGVSPDQFSLLGPLLSTSPHPLDVYAFNWAFDGYHLSTRFTLQNLRARDVMLMLNCLYSWIQPKDLATALSIFTDMPYHKNLSKSQPDIYNARDTYGALYAGLIAQEQLSTYGVTPSFERDMALLPTLEEMRILGVNCNVKEAGLTELYCVRALTKYEEWWRNNIPRYDWQSPKQLLDLFKLLNLPIRMKKRKRKDGTTYMSPTLEEEVLEEYRDEYHNKTAALLMEMRKLKKASDFTHIYSSDGRAHAQYKIHGQKQGRIQAQDPDIQNIPERIAGIFPRRIIIPDDPESVIITADFSQIELRVYAFCAKDQNYLSVFERGDYVYGPIYEEIFQKPFFNPGVPRTKANKASTVEPWELLVAKSGPLGLIYGRGKNSLTKMGVNQIQAARIFNDFTINHKPILNYHQELLTLANQQGYLRSLFGRMRRFPNPASQRNEILSFPGQINAADILRQNALIPLPPILKDMGGRILLTVHDSIAVSVKRVYVKEAAEMIKLTMEQPIPQMNGFRIPVEVRIGPNWHDTELMEKYAFAEGSATNVQELSPEF